MDNDLFCPIIYKRCYKIEGLTAEEEYQVCKNCKEYQNFKEDMDKTEKALKN